MPISAAVRLARHLEYLDPAEMAALSDRAGVQRKLGARARAGRKVNAMAYMMLCSAAGIDPATGIATPMVSRAGASIVWWMFGSGLFLTRTVKRLDLRVAADLVGVSAATLSRAERGQPVAIESFLRISDFIGIPAESFLCFTGNTNCNTLKVKEPADARRHQPVNAAHR